MRSVSYGWLYLSKNMNQPSPEYKSEALSLQNTYCLSQPSLCDLVC
jgi:hypothetical protein